MITMPVFPARCDDDMSAETLEYLAINAVDQKIALQNAIEQWNHDNGIETPVATPTLTMPPSLAF